MCGWGWFPSHNHGEDSVRKFSQKNVLFARIEGLSGSSMYRLDYHHHRHRGRYCDGVILKCNGLHCVSRIDPSQIYAMSG